MLGPRRTLSIPANIALPYPRPMAMHRPKLEQERRNRRILIFAVHTSSHNQRILQMSTYKYSQKERNGAGGVRGGCIL